MSANDAQSLPTSVDNDVVELTTVSRTEELVVKGTTNKKAFKWRLPALVRRKGAVSSLHLFSA